MRCYLEIKKCLVFLKLSRLDNTWIYIHTYMYIYHILHRTRFNLTYGRILSIQITNSLDVVERYLFRMKRRE